LINYVDQILLVDIELLSELFYILWKKIYFRYKTINFDSFEPTGHVFSV